MKIIEGKLSGFCDGVSNTINKAKKAIEENKKVYCLGEIVHNEKVVEILEKEGMITVYDIDEVPSKSKLIFRAHGEPKETYEKAQKKNIDIIDLTCGKVRAIHINVDREKTESFIIIIGKKTHPETIGTKSFAGTYSYVIQDESDILLAYKEYINSNLKKVYVVVQTTFSNLKYNALTQKIKKVFKEAEINIKNTICNATENRQKEVYEISKKVDEMLIIGGKHSSNTKELANIAEKNCKKVYLIQQTEDLKDIKFEKNEIIGIVTGASTPKEMVEELKQYIRQ